MRAGRHDCRLAISTPREYSPLRIIFLPTQNYSSLRGIFLSLRNYSTHARSYSPLRGTTRLCAELLFSACNYSSMRGIFLSGVTTLLYVELFFSALNYSFFTQNFSSLRSTIPLVHGAIPLCAELLVSAQNYSSMRGISNSGGQCHSFYLFLVHRLVMRRVHCTYSILLGVCLVVWT
jgi:hypothetical protein